MIKFSDVNAEWQEISDMKGCLISEKLYDFLNSGFYVLGENVKKFEQEFAKYCGADYAVGVANGTDALKLSIQILKDCMHSDMEVVIPANAHISSALAPAYFKCKTVVIDCDQDHNIDIKKLEEHFSKCDMHHMVIITHMYGLPMHIQKIRDINRDCLIIEDCSHAHGATFNGQHVGTFADMGVFSLYPTKNLGACGDAGIIITNSSEFDERLRALRNYGASEKDDCDDMGWNNRLDEIQALILREKLHHLDRWNMARFGVAELYNKFLKNVGDLILPPLTEGRVFHIYQIRTTRRDQLQAYLKKRDIPTLIHYRWPIYKTEQFHHLNLYPEKTPRAEAYCQEILSLPMHPYLTNKDIATICAAIGDFFKRYSCKECGGHAELMEGDDGNHLCRWCCRKIADFTDDIINPTGRYRQI